MRNKKSLLPEMLEGHIGYADQICISECVGEGPTDKAHALHIPVIKLQVKITGVQVKVGVKLLMGSNSFRFLDFVTVLWE